MHFIQHGHILNNGDAELRTWIITDPEALEAFREWRGEYGYLVPDSHILVPADKVPTIRDFNEEHSVSLTVQGDEDGD